MSDWQEKFKTFAHNALRIAAGAAFFSHGAQKLFGWFGGFGADGTAEFMTRFGAAGVIETVCGAAIVLGLFTRPLALFASGQMAVAYFWMHVSPSGQLFWWVNRGELALLYAFIWLFFAAYGPGSFSVDGWLKGRRERGEGPASASVPS